MRKETKIHNPEYNDLVTLARKGYRQTSRKYGHITKHQFKRNEHTVIIGPENIDEFNDAVRMVQAEQEEERRRTNPTLEERVEDLETRLAQLEYEVRE